MSRLRLTTSSVRKVACRCFFTICRLKPASPEEVPGGDPLENADTARRIFAGASGASRDLAVLNAAAAIYAGGGAVSIEQGVQVAERSVDSGAAQAALERFVNRTRELLERLHDGVLLRNGAVQER